MRSRIRAYAGVQLADYFTGRGLIAVMLTAIAAWGYATMSGLTAFAFDATTGVEGRAQLQRAFDVMLAVFALIAAALSAQNLVARHRRRGYDRVIFARALPPLRYYGQGFVVAGVGGVLLAVALAQVYAIAVHPVSVVGAAAYLGLVWLTIGGLALLLSTLTWLHTPLLVLLVGADLALDRYATALRASSQSNPVLDVGQYLLPPGHVLVSLSGSFARGVLVEPVTLAWPVAFGVACLVATSVLLRRRPFGS